MPDEKYENLVQQISGIGSDVKDLKSAFDSHHSEDLKWKSEAEPILRMGRNIQGFQTIGRGIIYVALSVAAIVGSLYGAITWLKK